MSEFDYLVLKGTTHFKKDALSENIEYSIIDFYKWGFLNIGAYQNISRSPATSGVYGGDRFRLSRVNDPRFTNGQIYQGFRNDWVYETGVSFSPAPTSVSIYVDGVLKPTNDSAYGHYIDYPGGRVVFNTAPASTKLIEANFCHRTVSFFPATTPWFRELMYDSYNISRSDFITAAASGGIWNPLSQNRLQLPMVGVETVSIPKFKGLQLGGGQFAYIDVLYYIFAENDSDRKQIRDIIASQNDRTVWTYDRGVMKESPNWPLVLDYRNTPVNGFLTYPSLVNESNGYRFRKIAFADTYAEDMELDNSFLYKSVVRTTCEITMPNI